jgi:hypothetical protein
MELTKSGNCMRNVKVIAIIWVHTKEHQPATTKTQCSVMVLRRLAHMHKPQQSILNLILPMMY